MAITTLPEMLRTHAAQRDEHTALVCSDTGRSWTYRELDALSDTVAAGLAALGVGAGDRIGFLDKNAPEYYPWLYGGSKLGAVTVAVNWRLAPAQIQYILDNADVRVILVGGEYVDVLSEIDLPSLEKVVVLGEGGSGEHPSLDQWLAEVDGEAPTVSVAPDSTCYQLYTSGTTGLPKGVELTHANLLELMPTNGYRMSPDTVNLACMPQFHVAGSAWGTVTHYWGATTIVLREVDVAKIFRLLPDHKVTHAMFVPAVLQGMVAVPGVDEIDFAPDRALARRSWRSRTRSSPA